MAERRGFEPPDRFYPINRLAGGCLQPLGHLSAGRLAEGVGFEPTEPYGSAVFKTAALDHSAIPPRDCRVRWPLNLAAALPRCKAAYVRVAATDLLRSGPSRLPLERRLVTALWRQIVTAIEHPSARWGQPSYHRHPRPARDRGAPGCPPS